MNNNPYSVKVQIIVVFPSIDFRCACKPTEFHSIKRKRTIVNSFKLKYPENVSIKVDVKEDLYLTTDRMHFSNIVSNLIDNAIKYSVKSAEITIFACEDSKGNIIVEVRDNGIGISKEQQKLIFDKFYRVPHGNVHDIKGYGLGLYYVKSMVEKLDGSVSVKSSYGKGSVFRLTLKRHYEK